jgi:hypothetical protein
MALLNLFLDTQSKRLVFSETQPVPISLPDLNQEDSFTIDFRALKRIRQGVAPFFERIGLVGYDLLISVGTANSILASASSWTASDGNTLLSGRLDLNTAGIAALADGAQVIFECRLFDGVGYYRSQNVCTVKKSVALVGGMQPVVNDQALGKLEASRTYLPVQGVTAFTMIDQVDGTEMIVRLSGGSLLAEPIT